METKNIDNKYTLCKVKHRIRELNSPTLVSMQPQAIPTLPGAGAQSNPTAPLSHLRKLQAIAQEGDGGS